MVQGAGLRSADRVCVGRMRDVPGKQRAKQRLPWLVVNGERMNEWDINKERKQERSDSRVNGPQLESLDVARCLDTRGRFASSTFGF